MIKAAKKYQEVWVINLVLILQNNSQIFLLGYFFFIVCSFTFLSLLGTKSELGLLQKEVLKMGHFGKGVVFIYSLLLSENESGLPCEAIKVWLWGELIQWCSSFTFKNGRENWSMSKGGIASNWKGLSFQNLLSQNVLYVYSFAEIKETRFGHKRKLQHFIWEISSVWTSSKPKKSRDVVSFFNFFFFKSKKKRIYFFIF